MRNDFFNNGLGVTFNLGDGTMSQPVTLPSASESAVDGVVTDLNGDGHLDIAVISEGSCLCNDAIDLYLGNGTGGFTSTTATGGDGPGRITAADLDADGDVDLALTNYWGGATASVLLNNGDATFAPEVLYPVGERPLGVISSDVEGDGDQDVVVAAAGFSGTELALYPLLNDGAGVLTPAPPQAIDLQLGNPILVAGDLDGDTDEDLVLGGLGDTHVFLFNDGGGAYTPILNNRGGFTSGDLEVLDLDGDGDLDVVSATYGSSQAGDITVFRNGGTGTFTAEFLDSSQQPSGLAVADFTGDGIVDIAAANRGSSLGIIHPGGPGGAFLVPDQTQLFAPPFKIAVGDLDGDGDTDIAATTVSGFSGQIQVLLNDGTGNMVPGPLIDAGGSPNSIDVADFDLDGDGDLVWQLLGFQFDDAGVSLSNGDGTFAAPEYLNVTNNGTGQVTAADMDGDTFPDILIANDSADSVTVVPSNGDGTFGPAYEIQTEALPAMAIGADMNGDGLNDLVTAHSVGNGGDVAVSLNNGDGTFAPHVEIDSGHSHLEIAAADLDLDGDSDLATVDAEDTTTVFLNDGTGTSFDITVLPGEQISGYRNGIAIDIGDIDNDGLPDVVVANWTGNDIGVYFNNGDGTFEPTPIHYGVNTGLSDLQLADFNADGRLDVAAPNTTANVGLAQSADEVQPLAAADNGVSVVLNTGGTIPPRGCTITGTSGADRLIGTAGPDVICGNAGNDVLVGGGGNDILIGGPGEDQLRGQSGHDQVYGGDGRDVVIGGTGNDKLAGGAGPDRCDGGPGTDTATACERTTSVP